MICAGVGFFGPTISATRIKAPTLRPYILFPLFLVFFLVCRILSRNVQSRLARVYLRTPGPDCHLSIWRTGRDREPRDRGRAGRDRRLQTPTQSITFPWQP